MDSDRPELRFSLHERLVRLGAASTQGAPATRAVIDPAAVGRGFQVLVHVTMEVKARKETMDAFEGRVAEMDEIIECRRMFGDPDYLLWVATMDLDAYEDLYMNKLVGLSGVARTVSQLTMKTIKPGGPLPL